MDINDAILINQLAQGIAEMDEGEKWFGGLDAHSKRDVIREINAMILQASPLQEDATSAIASTGMKPTLTPCVLLAKPNLRGELAKMASLPEPELPGVFKLLVTLLGIADKRRRETKPLDTASHWWHRDLRDPLILADIRKRYSRGQL